MPDNPFPPLRPMDFPDGDRRFSATWARARHLRWRRAAVTVGAVGAATAVVLLLTVGGSSPRSRSVRVVAPSSTVTTIAAVPSTPPSTPPSTGSTTTAVSQPALSTPAATVSRPTTATTLASAGLGSWTARAVPAGEIGPLNAVSCPTISECLAVSGDSAGDADGTIIASYDGGTNWSTVDKPAFASPSVDFDGIACPSETVCLAIGTRDTSAVLLLTTDSGRSWSQLTLSGPAAAALQYPNAVACVSDQTCVVAGDDISASNGGGTVPVIVRTTDGGSTWQAVTVPPGVASPTALWCSPTGFCLLGAAGPGPTASSKALASTSHDSGATWTAPVTSGEVLLGAVSCVNDSFCVGADGTDGTDTYGQGDLNVTHDGGATWTTPAGIGANSVACTPSMCLAVGAVYSGGESGTFPATAYLSTNGGTTWNADNPPGSQGLNSISCPTVNRCVAVGSLQSTEILTWQ